jgi:predicted enzyme related to lactoylglutathione lyase
MKYIHTNIIAKDWKRLAVFYETVFACERIPPERDLKGEWADAVTGIPGVRIRGAHLKLPGYDEDGPTLEIFEYNSSIPVQNKTINRHGFGHVAFRVDNVDKTLDHILAEGGDKLGDPVRVAIPGVGTLTVVYTKDPEGNFVEIQELEKDEDNHDSGH